MEFNFIFDRLEALCDDVFNHFKKSGFKSFKVVVLTVRFSDFETKNSSHTMTKPSDSSLVLKNQTLKTLMPYLDRRKNPNRKLIRLLGVRVENLAKK